MQALTSLVALQHLDLMGTATTDVGLHALASLVALQHLHLHLREWRTSQTWDCKR